jgi:hypothetical protein
MAGRNKYAPSLLMATIAEMVTSLKYCSPFWIRAMMSGINKGYKYYSVILDKVG